MGIKDLLRKLSGSNPRFKEIEQEEKFVNRLHEKKLSSNERELNRFKQEEREDDIKRELEEFRNREHDEVWHGGSALDVGNMFKNNGNEIITQRNLFSAKANNIQNRSLFFK